MKKRKIYVLVYDWVTMYDGSDISIQTFRTKAEARKAMNEAYRGTKKDMIENHAVSVLYAQRPKTSLVWSWMVASVNAMTDGLL